MIGCLESSRRHLPSRSFVMAGGRGLSVVKDVSAAVSMTKRWHTLTGGKEANHDAMARRENKNSRVVSNVVVVSKAEPRSLAAQISGQGCFFGNKKSRGFRFGTTLERTGQKAAKIPIRQGGLEKNKKDKSGEQCSLPVPTGVDGYYHQ